VSGLSRSRIGRRRLLAVDGLHQQPLEAVEGVDHQPHALVEPFEAPPVEPLGADPVRVLQEVRVPDDERAVPRLRIWGSAVRIRSGAPFLETFRAIRTAIARRKVPMGDWAGTQADDSVSGAADYESGGQEFESLRARHLCTKPRTFPFVVCLPAITAYSTSLLPIILMALSSTSMAPTIARMSNLTPADVYFGRGQTILLERERIKRNTIQKRRLQHQKKAA
jgi:hypothetical protein